MNDTKELNSDELFIRRIIAIFGRKQEVSFEEVVRQYREVETEFVALASDDEVKVLDRKRSITNHLLMEADREQQPHQVCREIWEELMQRGFWDITMMHTMSSTYARCCQRNGKFDAGIEVLDARIAELGQLLQDPMLTPQNHAFCNENLHRHKKIRDELQAGVRE